MIREYFYGKIAENKLLDVLEKVQDICIFCDDAQTPLEILHLKSRINYLDQNDKRGVIDKTSVQIELNNIRTSVIDLTSKFCDKMESDHDLRNKYMMYKKLNHRMHVQCSDNNISIDFTLIFKFEKKVQYRTGAYSTVGELSHEIYYLIQDYVAPFSYGTEWILRNASSKSIISNDAFSLSITEFISNYSNGKSVCLYAELIKSVEKYSWIQKISKWLWLNYLS